VEGYYLASNRVQIQSKPLLRLRLRVPSRSWPAPKMIQKKTKVLPKN
jgi:hypothetical protein